jgi:hypothetical protein
MAFEPRTSPAEGRPSLRPLALLLLMLGGAWLAALVMIVFALA